MNTEDLLLAWQRVCQQLKSYPTTNIPQMEAFFSRVHPQAMSGGFLALSADNNFIKDNVERFYLSSIHQALKDLFGQDYFVMIEVFEEPAPPTPSTAPSISYAATDKPDTAPEPSAEKTPVDYNNQNVSETDRDGSFEDQRSDTAADAQTNPTGGAKKQANGEKDALTSPLTFENYVIGDSNRMAYSMALEVAENPGQSTFLNPLFIYGKSGLGKTHLLRAIQNNINDTRPELAVIYTDSADLLTDYVNAGIGREKGYNSFKKKYEEADVLLIDDIQFLQGKKQTLDIVFQIFNKMIDRGSQVILSADRAPKNIDIDERYQSRFNSGGTIDIQPPEIETKLGIIKSYIEEYVRNNPEIPLTLPDDVKLYIAQISSSNMRELKSAVTKVILHMSFLSRTSIPLVEVKEILDNHFSGGPSKRLSVADIQREVEDYYKISHDDLIGKKRDRNISHARKVAIYLCRQMLDIPFNSIGKEFNKDHSTMIYSVNAIDEKMHESRELREEIDTLRQIIREA